MTILHAPEGKYRLTAKPPESLVTGDWYYGWECMSCKERMAVINAKPGGKQARPVMGDKAVVLIRCPHCGHENTLPMEEEQHFRHPL